MAHKVFGNKMLMLRDTPAWHGLGTVFTEDLTVTEAAQKIGMFYTVHKVPLPEITFGGHTVDTGMYALIREAVPGVAETPEFFGIVGSEYTVIDNQALFAALDPLTGAPLRNGSYITPPAGGYWKLDTIGAVNAGRDVFITFKLPPGEVRGDAVTKWLLVHAPNDGRTAASVSVVYIRTVCNNTLQANLSANVPKVIVPHNKDVTEQLSFFTHLIFEVQKAVDATQAAFERMADYKIISDQVDEIFKAVWPDPPEPGMVKIVNSLVPNGMNIEVTDTVAEALVASQKTWEYTKERTDKFRDAARYAYDLTNKELEPLGLDETAWAVYNAITYVETHRKGDAQSRAESILWGNRHKTMDRAFSVIMDKMKAR